MNIRNNAMSAQAMLDDLMKWQAQQKEKDDALREQGRSDASAASQTPIRASAPPAYPSSDRCSCS